MKKLALIFVCGVASMTLNAKEYTIQVISACKESSITPAFEKKVKKTGIPYIKKEEGERHVLLVGSYATQDHSRMDMKKVKRSVAHDAFVRPKERRAIPCVTSHDEQKSTKESNPASTASVVANHTEPSVAVTAVSSVIQNHDANITGQMKEGSLCPHPVASADVVMVYDRNAIRKYDISEAIEYYKNSSYYTFKSTAGR